MVQSKKVLCFRVCVSPPFWGGGVVFHRFWCHSERGLKKITFFFRISFFGKGMQRKMSSFLRSFFFLRNTTTRAGNRLFLQIINTVQILKFRGILIFALGVLN